MKQIGTARPATAADMSIIEKWLPKDRSLGTLADNWNLTMRMFIEGQVHVWDDTSSSEPVAYCWGSLNSHDSILEVCPAFRGLGFGRGLATFMIENSIANREPLLEIQISPKTSEPFWQAMGFETYREGRFLYGRRTLQFEQKIPNGILSSITVSFFPECDEWMDDVQPLAVHRMKGGKAADCDNIVLEATVACFDLGEGSNLVVEVLVDGQSRYRGKAKYDAAKALGIRRCRNGFMIGEVVNG